MKAPKEDLNQLNKHEFEFVAFKKKSLMCELLSLDVKEGDKGLAWEERAQRDESKFAIEWLATHEQTWCKKSRALWLKEGGNNTSFFP